MLYFNYLYYNDFIILYVHHFSITVISLFSYRNTHLFSVFTIIICCFTIIVSSQDKLYHLRNRGLNNKQLVHLVVLISIFYPEVGVLIRLPALLALLLDLDMLLV